ncbi:hypothetical protein CYLTODRAFT_454635 [Cylindrobasidium torrendii FP15055 ss-10]|uniref:GST N-terminal domain-containing protein n=1 Tax=Cylindrobasidium torrendii FP15055 ss-10 TaxID=1314674 RepID=A0A0D7BCG1_9AGAR|nr:hypothetical protein CYLTODRAFT_454635 [Cylindrobasidium torrendii FP15055 ss-10]
MLTLFDIPSKRPHKAWSPNTWKARYCLNFKRLPYQTEWVEYPDIAALYETRGIPPCERKPDGSPYYTLPLLHDSASGVYISGTLAIAEYLEEQYPGAPTLFPEPARVRALVSALDSAVQTDVLALKFIIPRAYGILNERSAVFFRETREKRFGCAIEEIEPQGAKKAEAWGSAREGLDGYAVTFYPHGQRFMLGDSLTYADIFMAGRLKWAQVVFGEDSEEWKEMRTWSGGRWARLLDSLAPYERVDA